MNLLRISIICFAIIGISFSEIEAVRLLGIVLVVLSCFFELEENLKKLQNKM